MTALRFDLKQVARLLAHAKTSTEHRTIYDEVTGAGLWWIKDEGTYIMSNGLPALTENHVVYAEGFDADCDWDLLRDACGGDDFAEFLGDDVCEMIARCDGADGHLIIKPTANMFIVEVKVKAGAKA